jgi:hypothetical protein
METHAFGGPCLESVEENRRAVAKALWSISAKKDQRLRYPKRSLKVTGHRS